MVENNNYDEAVEVIKTAILRSQYDAASYSNGNQLALYYGVGKYISLNSRKGFWGKGAIDTISERLSKQLPGLRGFTPRNLRYMRTFYEEWISLDSSVQKEQIEAKESDNLELAIPKLQISGYCQFGTYKFQIMTNSPWQIFCTSASLTTVSFLER